MAASASPIPELENVIQAGSPQQRAEALKRITAFFLSGASRFNEDHVRLFDDVFGRLIAEIESKARAELAHRLAPVANAPVEVVRRLAQDDDIAVAGPVLLQSRRLAETDLVDIARTKSQAHLLAISGRAGIAEPVTEVLVRRGDREVVRTVAENRQARLSKDSFSALVDRAEKDGVLAEKVGLRPDIPPRLFRDLLLKATEVVQQRLFASAARDASRDPARPGESLRRGRRLCGTARLFAGPAHDRGAAPGGQARRGRARRLRQGPQIRGDDRSIGAALLGADRRGGPADGRRPARSDPHPLQVGRLGMADRQDDHHGTADRQGTVEPGARQRLCQFRTVVAGDRAARDAVLAIAEDRASSE